MALPLPRSHRISSMRSVTLPESEALRNPTFSGSNEIRQISNEEHGLNENFVEFQSETTSHRIPCRDLGRVRKFYSHVFSCFRFEKASFTELFWVSGDQISGSFVLKTGTSKSSHYTHDPLMYLQVEDIDATIDLIIEAGGIVCSPKKLVVFCEDQVSATFIDSEGNHMGVFALGGNAVEDTDDYSEEFIVAEPASSVYKMFTNEEVHTKHFGNATVEGKVMGRFKSVVGNGITGLFIELEQDRLVLIGCRVKSWNPRHYARLHIELLAQSPDETLVRWNFYDVPVAEIDQQSVLIDTIFPNALR